MALGRGLLGAHAHPRDEVDHGAGNIEAVSLEDDAISSHLQAVVRQSPLRLEVADPITLSTGQRVGLAGQVPSITYVRDEAFFDQ